MNIFEQLNKINDNESLRESIKPENIVPQIVSTIENAKFTKRSISATDTTITMEDKKGDKVTYSIRVKYVPQFILEEELVGEVYKTCDKDEFIKESSVLIMKN